MYNKGLPRIATSFFLSDGRDPTRAAIDLDQYSGTSRSRSMKADKA